MNQNILHQDLFSELQWLLEKRRKAFWGCVCDRLVVTSNMLGARCFGSPTGCIPELLAGFSESMPCQGASRLGASPWRSMWSSKSRSSLLEAGGDSLATSARRTRASSRSWNSARSTIPNPRRQRPRRAMLVAAVTESQFWKVG